MNEIAEEIARLESLGSRVKVKHAVLDMLTKKLAGSHAPIHCFMMDVAFPYCSGIAHPSHETEYPPTSIQKFKELWDRLT